MPKGEEIPKTSPTEIEHLIERVQQPNLALSAKEKIARLLRTVSFLINLLQRKNLSIRKLRELVFGPRTPKSGHFCFSWELLLFAANVAKTNADFSKRVLTSAWPAASGLPWFTSLAAR